jgi:hypothetical protein
MVSNLFRSPTSSGLHPFTTPIIGKARVHIFQYRKHGLINYKDTKTKCRLYRCFIEFIDWRYSQSCWYFRPSFLNYCPSNLLSGSPPPPLPLPKVKVQYIQFRQCVAGRGWGVLSCVEDHILFLNRFRTYKIATPPQTKT